MIEPPQSRPTPAAPISTPLLFAGLLIVDSLHFVFARALLPYLPPEMSAFLLLGIAAIEVGTFQAARGGIRVGVLWRHWRFFAAIGLMIAASTAINYTAVAFIDPGTASLLGKTSVLFTLALGALWLRERLRPVELLGAALAIAGAFVIGFQPGAPLRLGSVLVLVSTFLYALHTAVVKRHGEGIDFGSFFLWRIATTAAFLLAFATARGALVWPGRTAWLLATVAATVDVVISRALYYLSLRRMPMSIHTIILTLSPVVTILWALALFGESPSVLSLVGGALVVAGVAVVMLRPRR
ncbi:MAG TPA: DMT family transporter [Promineifilum sp.]|nr:DMT family transporter [Promineifilum sp.]HQF71988.1 DMT family transporter [Promineifilum sp.]